MINDLRAKDNKDSKHVDEEKSFKKWEKLIVKTYFEKLKISYSDLNLKLEEKYIQDEEVKSIISELKTKIKEFDYLVKKQWQTLKKFNLQEKIYREESKHLIESEASKRNEIYKDVIEKLTAAHVRGFEPSTILKNKLFNKMQIKYKISENVMKDLTNIFNRTKYSEEEENLLKMRYEDQVKILETFIKTNAIVIDSTSMTTTTNIHPNMSINKGNHSLFYKFSKEKDPDILNFYHHYKQEIKRYEKELEMKAGKGAYLLEEKDENMEDLYINHEEATDFNEKKNFEDIGNFSSFVSIEKNNDFNPNINKRLTSSLVLDRENNNDDLKNSKSVDDKLIFSQPVLEFPEKISKSSSNIKLKDILKISEPEQIVNFKEKIVDDFKIRLLKELNPCGMINSTSSFMTLNNIENANIQNPQKTFYKSKILNDMFVKHLFN